MNIESNWGSIMVLEYLVHSGCGLSEEEVLIYSGLGTLYELDQFLDITMGVPL